MAVYTRLTEKQLTSALKDFGFYMQAYHEAEGGIENTTYFLTTTDGSRFVLTLFEELDQNVLPWFVELTTKLNHEELPVPCPVPSLNGNALVSVAGKPAVLVPLVEGGHPELPGLAACKAIGGFLGNMHCYTGSQEFIRGKPNPRGDDWMKKVFGMIEAELEPEQKVLAEKLLQLRQKLPELPRGIVHGDLFRDNTLYIGDRLAGVIDFYNAGTDYLLMDLAVVVNDWAFIGAEPDKARFEAITGSYKAVRPFRAEEEQSWPELLQLAASRFWFSRLRDSIFPRQGDNQVVKPPEEYEGKCRYWVTRGIQDLL
jgi:homoserine kinase type II